MKKLKEIQIGPKPADMSVREYESSVRSFKRRNVFIRLINQILRL